MFNKKQKSCVKCIHLVTDDGLYNQKAFFKVKIVFYSTSLLPLSKGSLKCITANIDFLEYEINIFSKNITLHFISSGHYTILLNDSYEGSSSLDDSRFIEIFLTIDNLHDKSQAEKVQIAMKLHKQFGDQKGSRLINLMKSAGISDNVLLDAVKNLDDNCSICY